MKKWNTNTKGFNTELIQKLFEQPLGKQTCHEGPWAEGIENVWERVPDIEIVFL